MSWSRFLDKKILETQEKCTKCGICKRVRPTQVTEVYEKKVETSQHPTV